MIAELSGLILEGALATSLALLLVLPLRGPVRRRFGAGCVPALWALVPLAQIAVLLPAPARTPLPVWPVDAMAISVASTAAVVLPDPQRPWDAWLLAIWLLGTVGCAFCLWLMQRRFRRGLGTLRPLTQGILIASRCDAGPAVLGVLRPHIVLPADFRRRYTPQQRRLILAHEHSHARRGDVAAHAIASLLRCLYWFNPLLHIATGRLRHDQELAADADVIRRHPDSRRRYAATLLDVQLAVPGLPVGCLWQSSHPLKERIMLLKQATPSRLRRTSGLALVTGLALGVGFAAWAGQPSATTKDPDDTGTVRAALCHVRFTLTVDAQASAPEVVVEDGKDFSLASGPWQLGFACEQGHLVRPDVRLRGASIATVDLDALNAGQTLHLEAPDGGAGMTLAARTSWSGTDRTTRPATGARLSPPPYPQAALDAHQSGRVLLQVEVGADGLPTQVTVEKSVPEGMFDTAAVEAVRRWRFEPAQRDGRPVASAVRVPICFQLKDEAAGGESHRCEVSGQDEEGVTVSAS